MNLLGISGSPSLVSRSGALLRLTQRRLAGRAARSDTLVVRDLPAAVLVTADVGDPHLGAAIELVARADVVIVSTPIYKAAYSGLLKLFLDVLPQEALRGKTVLPLATGGSPAHVLALDYAIKPVLGVLGARDILDGVYAVDATLRPDPAAGDFQPSDELLARLDAAIAPVLDRRADERPWRVAA